MDEKVTPDRARKLMDSITDEEISKLHATADDFVARLENAGVDIATERGRYMSLLALSWIVGSFSDVTTGDIKIVLQAIWALYELAEREAARMEGGAQC